MMEKPRFERMLFRATRGNCLVRFSDVSTPLADPVTGEDVSLTVFMVVFRSTLIETKVRKIVDAFDGHAYDIADFNDALSVKRAYSRVMLELEDSERVLKVNIDKCEEVLRQVAHYMRVWRWTVTKEKAVFDVFNKFRPVSAGNMYGEGWVLTESLDDLRTAIDEVHRGKESTGYMEIMAKPWPMPPTHFHTNEFTSITQVVVDTYGVPTYKECNPAVFTLVTFPFQFGIMFGDFGHAIFITLAATYFLVRSKYLKKHGMNEIISMIFSGRCMIILMGIYAMYVGFLYNDQFSLGVDWFGSTWSFPNDAQKGVWSGRVYPVGMDPVWHDKENALLFYNSFKMKFAVIFGISQMILGVVLKFMNTVYHKNWVDFWCEAVPQMVFMLTFFGWMIVLIVVKWLINWDERMAGNVKGLCNPPSLINTLINFALKPGSVSRQALHRPGHHPVLAAHRHGGFRALDAAHQAHHPRLQEARGGARDRADEEPHTASLRGRAHQLHGAVHLPGYRDHRVLSGMHFSHRLVPASVGPVAGSLAAVGGVLEQDHAAGY